MPRLFLFVAPIEVTAGRSSDPEILHFQPGHVPLGSDGLLAGLSRPHDLKGGKKTAGISPGVIIVTLPNPCRPDDPDPERTFPGSLIAPDHHSMRIALFTEAYAPQVNGVVRTQVELVRYLRMRGHQVLQAVPYHKSNPRQEQVVEFRAFLFRFIRKCPSFSLTGDFTAGNLSEWKPSNPTWFI